MILPRSCSSAPLVLLLALIGCQAPPTSSGGSGGDTTAGAKPTAETDKTGKPAPDAAAATGARARSAGVSIGRFFTRASKAGANAF